MITITTKSSTIVNPFFVILPLSCEVNSKECFTL